MLDWARHRVLTALRVPAAPKPPDGSPESLLIFRAGKNFFYLQFVQWFLQIIGVIVGVFALYAFTWKYVQMAPVWVHYMVIAGEIFGVLGVAVASPFTFLAMKWQYELRWYIVTDRSLRIRRGVWEVEELTMTFANIQEIRVQAGPVQKLLGLADVEVHAAGGGAIGKHGEQRSHKALFEGVDNANTIRDLLVERLREYRELGLGDKVSPATPPLLDFQSALLQVRDEATNLRKALQAT
ncbi:MAG: PH domain-containing protein [Acidobacteria bacterium]|nr:PH domain-containing protein [Acidobacteriota bacterium]